MQPCRVELDGIFHAYHKQSLASVPSAGWWVGHFHTRKTTPRCNTSTSFHPQQIFAIRVFALSSSFLSHAPGLQHAGVPRAHEEELVNLGQLLHRLVSKPSCVSVRGFSLVFLHFILFYLFFLQRYPLSVTGSFSAELQMVNKWVFFFSLHHPQ